MNEVTTPGDPVKEFQENIQSKLREQIGTLMPESMLRKIVEDSINSILYKDTKTHAYRQPQYWIVDTVKDAIGEHINEIVRRVIEERKEEIVPILEKEIKTQFPALMAEFLRNTIVSGGNQLGSNIGIAISQEVFKQLHR